jgi:hypothetical protein
VVASLPLQGQAKAVTLEGSTTSAETQTAYVATGSYGLAVVNASQFQRPIILGQIDLTGDAVDVAVDSRLGIAAVASTSALHLVDVSDPASPRLIRSINVPAAQVEIVNGLAYVAASNGIEAYSLISGEQLDALPLSNVSIVSLAREGSMLYAVDAGRTLRAVDTSGLAMQARGTLALPPNSARVFVGNGIAYIGASNGDVNGGFVTAVVSNPDSMSLLSGVDAANVQGKVIVANGSGLGIAVGQLYNFGYFSSLDVMDLSDPSNTGAFLTRVNLPVEPFDVAIGSGIAFVAGGTAGLSVVNYLPFDNRGVRPTVTVTAPNADRDPATPGIQALEGSIIDLKLDVADDRQVRNVELLVDGQVVANDVSFPWTTLVGLPVLSAGADTVVVQARATDTGGNSTLSDPLAIALVPDTFAPTIVRSNVPEGSRHAKSFQTLRLQFSEAMDPASLIAANFALRDAADNLIVPVDVALVSQGTVAQITVPALQAGQYSLLIQADQVRDRAGNALGSGQTLFSSFTISEATIEWVGTIDGNWNNPANWDLGRLPGPSDDVLIDVATAITVTHNSGDTHVHSLTVAENFVLSGGTLTVDEFLTAEKSFALNGGTLKHATLNLAPASAMSVTNNAANRLESVTVNGDLNLGTSAVMVVKDLVLNGTATLADFASIGFDGTQRLEGQATIVFDTTRNDRYAHLEMSNAGTLTLGAQAQLRGGAGALGYTGRFNQAMELVNEGTISADVTGRTILFGGSGRLTSFTNKGTLNALNGGSLSVQAPSFTNRGTLESLTGGSFSLVGSQVANSGLISVSAGTSGFLSFGAWSNTGTLRNAGDLELSGTIQTAGLGQIEHLGGVVRFRGTVQNEGQTLTLGATAGEWVFDRGLVIEGGRVVATGSTSVAPFAFPGNGGSVRLVDMTFAGDLNVNGWLQLDRVTLEGTFHLKAGVLGGTSFAAVLAFEGDQTLSRGTILFEGGASRTYITMTRSGTLTLGPDVVLRAKDGQAAIGSYFFGTPEVALINQGLIEADGRSITITAGGVRNEGTLRTLNGGTLSLQANASTNEGVMSAVNGTISLTNLAPNLGTIEAGVGGLVSIIGNLSNDPAATLRIVIGGAAADQRGRISVTGTADLAGTLAVKLTNGFVPAIDQSFQFLSAASVVGSFGAVVDEDPEDGRAYVVVATSTTASLNTVLE